MELKKYLETTTDRKLQLVNALEKQKKKKYSSSKESNKFAKLFKLTWKEIDIKDKAKPPESNQLKNARWKKKKKNYIDTKNEEMS